jgi:hypothetical protein
LRFAIAHVGNVKSSGAQTLDNSGGAQGGGGTLVTGRKSCGARWNADNRNLSGLPDNLYRQRKLLRKKVMPVLKRELEERTCLLMCDSITGFSLWLVFEYPRTVPELRECATQTS